MADTLELDFETSCDIDIVALGLDRYSRHPSCRVLMCAYALNGSDFAHWEAHKRPLPADLREALIDPEVEKWAFNAQFERVIAKRALKLPVGVRNWRCTQVLAGCMSFSGGLAEIAQRVGLPQDRQKMTAGKRLIRMFSMPQKTTKNQPHVWRDWTTDPAEWEMFCEYNVQDCVAERAVRHRLINYPVPALEWEIYEIDQIINDRGKPVDREFVRSAIQMCNRRKEVLTIDMKRVTGLSNPGSPAQLTPWLRERGYPFSDIRKETVLKVMTGNRTKPILTPEAVEALDLREWQARLSIKKYDAILEHVGEDERYPRARYMLQMMGAPRTGRWAGRGPQPQNLSSTPAYMEDPAVLEIVNGMIRDGDYEMLSIFSKEPLAALVGATRSSFQTPDGETFVVADLASIESAVIGWLADCPRLLAVFREGRDPYMDFATEFYQLAYAEVTRAQRKICKPPSLGCGFRLGGGDIYDGKRTGLWAYAENMGVDMTREEAHRAVKVFRETYPEIESMWKQQEWAVERTMRTKNNTKSGKLEFEYRKPFLLMWLPTGRPIYYYQPKMMWRTIRTGRMETVFAPRGMNASESMFMFGVMPGEEYEREETYNRLSLTYMGQEQKTRQWVRIDSHGGRTTEQSTQGTAREALAYGLVRAHREKFYLCSHVHDELVSIRRQGDNYHTVQQLVECMKTPIPGLEGLPLNAHGWEGRAYRKD